MFIRFAVICRSRIDGARDFSTGPAVSGGLSSVRKALLHRVPARTAAGIMRELGGFPQTPFLATTKGEQIFAKFSPFPGHQLCSSWYTP